MGHTVYDIIHQCECQDPNQHVSNTYHPKDFPGCKELAHILEKILNDKRMFIVWDEESLVKKKKVL